VIREVDDEAVERAPRLRTDGRAPPSATRGIKFCLCSTP
jgi:hypothetical protein